MTVPKEATTPDMLRLAVAAVLEADTEFRANMPPEWEGDPLSDEIDGLRRVFSSTLPIAGEGKVKALNWEDHSDAVSTMQCTVGQVGEPYHVFCENLMFFAYSGNREIARALSMGDAKAAVQTDYETRILPTLISSPVAVPEGWQLVPAKITLDMQHAYFRVVDDNLRRVSSDACFGRYDSQKQAYRAMLAAAPTPPPGKDGGQEVEAVGNGGKTLLIAERMTACLDKESNLSPATRVCLVELVSAIERDKAEIHQTSSS